MSTTPDFKCPKCGGKDFTIIETYVWKGYISEDGQTMDAKHKTCEIEHICCDNCDTDVTEWLNQEPPIQINFN